jgi:hypothetical protein
VRQHQIENDRIESFRGRQRESTLPVGGRLHNVSFLRQPIGQRHDKTVFIFDEENLLLRHLQED